jgi:uncharacterized integral membrane protein
MSFAFMATSDRLPAQNRLQSVSGTEKASNGFSARQWVIAFCALLLALFFLLNLQTVKVHLLIATVNMPLVIALAIAALLGVLLGWAVPRLRTPRT